MDAKIYSITAREILDSRGDPTIETTVILNSGYRGTASVPSGTSIGTYEAVELRDNDPKRYGGRGVLTAITNVQTIISKEIRGMDALNQGAIDKKMVDIDGTKNKGRLGANAILSVSLATAVAAARHSKTPLYRYLNQYAGGAPLKRIPIPILNIINGGKHGAGNLDFQEFQIVPASNKSFSEGLQLAVEIYKSLEKLLTYQHAIHSVGYEGGFAPNLLTNTEALELLTESVKGTAYRAGVDVFFGLDIAASNFHSERGYQIKDNSSALQQKDMIEFFQALHTKYRLLLLEDPLDEDDWEGWTEITKQLGKDTIIIGDDLLATNGERLTKAISQNACSAILMKPNQIGTLSEFFAVAAQAKQHGIKIIVSHRSGETTDNIIADLAVALQSDYVKFGAPARGERVVKYNRLLEIASELQP